MVCKIKAQAKAEGKKRYFTEKPCANGHIAERNTSTGRCVECNRLRMRKYWADYPEAVEKRNKVFKEYKFKNPENYAKLQEVKKYKWRNDEEYRLKTSESSKLKNRIRYLDPIYAEKRKKQGKEWFKNNSGIAKEKRARRRASQKNATPSWLTSIDKAKISSFYEIASALDVQIGVKHHVDHIVPIKGKSISGLHVPWNLQVLTATENLRKHNCYEIF
jgi:hypothetical protein